MALKVKYSPIKLNVEGVEDLYFKIYPMKQMMEIVNDFAEEDRKANEAVSELNKRAEAGEEITQEQYEEAEGRSVVERMINAFIVDADGNSYEELATDESIQAHLSMGQIQSLKEQISNQASFGDDTAKN